MSGALTWVCVAALGGCGALARFRLDAAVSRRMAGDFAWGTLTVNVIAAFAAGLVAGAGIEGRAEILVAVGGLGSFSTFSTWMLETQRLAEEGRSGLAAANAGVAVLAGLASAGIGWGLGSLL